MVCIAEIAEPRAPNIAAQTYNAVSLMRNQG